MTTAGDDVMYSLHARRQRSTELKSRQNNSRSSQDYALKAARSSEITQRLDTYVAIITKETADYDAASTLNQKVHVIYEPVEYRTVTCVFVKRMLQEVGTLLGRYKQTIRHAQTRRGELFESTRE